MYYNDTAAFCGLTSLNINKMPPVNQPKPLYSMAEDALCYYIYMVSIGASMTDSTDKNVVNEELDKLFLNEKHNLKIPNNIKLPKYVMNKFKSAVHLKRTKLVLEKHGHVLKILSKQFETLPASFVNNIINKIFAFMSKMIVDDDKQIRDYLNDEWSFGPRLRIGLHIILMSMFSSKVSNLNFNPVSNRFCNVLANFFMKPEEEDNPLINDIEEKKEDILTNTIFEYTENLKNITSLSLQNLASARLVWKISCCCPNLWYLDISGNLCDLERHCELEKIREVIDITKAAKGVADNGSDNLQTTMDRLVNNKKFENFISALGGFYAKNDIELDTCEGLPVGCFYLRTLFLPEIDWNSAEELMLQDHVGSILEHCKEIQEIQGINMFSIFFQRSGLENFPHILKLRKFCDREFHKALLAPVVEIFGRIGVPFVEEVDMVLNYFMGPKTLEHFPNMKHLKVCPLSKDAYTLTSMLPYISNLHSLDIKLTHSITIDDMCQLAKNCQQLESLKIECPGLRLNSDGGGDDDDNGSKSEKTVKRETTMLKKKPQCAKTKRKLQQQQGPRSRHKRLNFPQYIQSWLKKDHAPFERENSPIPKFSRLHTLMFSGMQHIEAAALYKCIRGSPKVCTFSLIVVRKVGDLIQDINDEFVCRICPLMKCLQHFTLSAETEEHLCVMMYGLTSASVEHLQYQCENLLSIGNVASWSMTTKEVKDLNKNFETQNYILRLC
ncbi:hypothetical protein Pmani_013142 [Petrolisthes manimaculis]|uniref:Uncharacterized protein n=1 Tax=Petrolisthes manimaculis TaxID=1843537 RepID=A0AAE1PWL3_9EUCA|nr:hypothetical protein Pmani_013142 [Petrolisthes manimaculis]